MKSDLRVTCAGRKTVSESWTGVLHSAFSSAANILLPSGALYTIVLEERYLSEKCMVAAPQVLDRARGAGGFLFDGGALFIDGTAVSVEDKIWEMPRFVKGELKGLQGLEKRLLPSADIFVRAVEERFKSAARKFMFYKAADFTGVLGAGPGLTPSGDDMLAGFALALLYTAPERLPVFAEHIRPYLDRTSEISGRLLADALDGSFSAALVNLLSSLETGAGVDIRFEEAAGVGASSGKAGITGLSFGLTLGNIL